MGVLHNDEPTVLSNFQTSLANARTAGINFAVATYIEALATSYAELAQADLVNMHFTRFIYGPLLTTGPDAGMTYEQLAQKYAALMRAANPNLIITLQATTRSPTSGQANSPYMTPKIRKSFLT